MRLIVFFTYGVSLKTWADTGLLQREIQFYLNLQQSGVVVEFLTYGDASDRQWENVLDGIGLLPVYEYVRRPRSKLMRFLQSFVLPLLIAGKLRNADLFKTNQMWGGWVAVVASRLFAKPLLVRCGYEAYWFSLQANITRIRQLGLWCVSWLTYRSAKHVVVATDRDAAFVRATFGVARDAISVHPNWINTEVFSYVPSQGSHDRVLFVGRLSKEKQVSLLLRSLENTGLALDVLGDGPLRMALEIEARQRGVDARFLGVVPNDQLPSIYNAHRVYVLCSRYEGNPKSLLEAMACGCAVIGTDVPGISEVIRHGETGLLVEQNPEALREAIQRLISDAELRAQLGRKACRQIDELNSLHALIQNELRIYDKLLKKGALFI